jgi:putative ABC transport system permease protein
VIRLIWSGVRFAPGRAMALGAGMLVAAIAFALLTASVDVEAARIKGVVGRNWRGAYDLLVLPAKSVQAATAHKHLVQVNYLSADTSGISVSQYRRIARLPGVGVAAPLAVVGYLLESASIPITLSSSAVGQSGARVLIVTSQFTADRGLSSYPPQGQGYVYITPDRLGSGFYPAAGDPERLPSGKVVRVCGFPGAGGAASASPFQVSGGLLLGTCYSRRTLASGPVQEFVTWSFPVLLAGIDPVAENELTGLGRALTSGRYLRESETVARSNGGRWAVVPLLASTRSFDGDDDHLRVGLLPPAAVGVARSTASLIAVTRRLAAERARPVMRLTISGAQAWSQVVSSLTAPISNGRLAGSQVVGQYWTAGRVVYRPGARGELEPTRVDNPVSVWSAGAGEAGYVAAPPAAADIGFRPLSAHQVTPSSDENGGPPIPVIRVVGEFNPFKLAGFAAAGPGSALASYRAPLLTGADPASRAALADMPLGPDGNLAGYAQQPPLILTTLGGAAAIEDEAAATAGNGGRAAAPIGSIRVRVSGLRGTLQEKLTKIAGVGQEIRKATGLQVIVTAGASGQQVTVGLPAGAFGRPALALSETWTAIGVALAVTRGADRESVALFVLILVVCVLFLAGASLAGVRGRRTEVGALRALGWGRWQVFTLVLGEVTVSGVAAGLAGTGLSAALILLLGLRLALWRALLVLPVAMTLAVLSGLVPAWLAASAEPTDALGPAARAPRRGGIRVRGLAGLAVTDLARTPGRCVLSGAALGAGVAGLSVLLAAQLSFRQSIGDSALGGLVTTTTRTNDVLAAVLAVGLGAVAVADITYLNLRERSGELAALSACGWGRAQIGRLLAYEAVLIGAAGSLAGGVAGLAAAATAFGVAPAVLAGAAIAAVAGTLTALVATLAVLATAADNSLTSVLAADE